MKIHKEQQQQQQQISNVCKDRSSGECKNEKKKNVQPLNSQTALRCRSDVVRFHLSKRKKEKEKRYGYERRFEFETNTNANPNRECQ